MIMCDNCINVDICKYVCRCKEADHDCKNILGNTNVFHNIQLIYSCKYFKSKDLEDETDCDDRKGKIMYHCEI